MLEKIFECYYESKLNKKNGESTEIKDAYARAFEEISDYPGDLENVMEAVSLYGIAAEKEGFLNGFRIAWKLMEEMNK